MHPNNEDIALDIESKNIFLFADKQQHQQQNNKVPNLSTPNDDLNNNDDKHDNR